MKRSEMVELLSKSFFKHMNDENYTNDTDMYSAILKDIEDVGMSPPVRYVFYTNDNQEIPGNYEFGVAVYTWENK